LGGDGALLALRGVWKMLGGRWILRGVDLEVAPGDRVLVWGANGSGKTTLLRVAAGLVEPSRGRVWRPCRRGCVGYVAHTPQLYPQLTVEENMEFHAAVNGAEWPGGFAWEAWEALGLSRYRRYRVSELSFGWRRRADIVRALIGSPPLLLLDEPFTGLDPEAAEAVAGVIGEAARRGAGVVMTSPRPGDEYLEAAGRVYRLEGGRLEEWG
jgi:heme exporter protein A